jgi:hypothetical protein
LGLWLLLQKDLAEFILRILQGDADVNATRKQEANGPATKKKAHTAGDAKRSEDFASMQGKFAITTTKPSNGNKVW